MQEDVHNGLLHGVDKLPREGLSASTRSNLHIQGRSYTHEEKEDHIVITPKDPETPSTIETKEYGGCAQGKSNGRNRVHQRLQILNGHDSDTHVDKAA